MIWIKFFIKILKNKKKRLYIAQTIYGCYVILCFYYFKIIKMSKKKIDVCKKLLNKFNVLVIIIKKDLQRIFEFLKLYSRDVFKKITKYLRYNLLMILVFIFIIFILVVYYQNKLDNIKSSSFIYYDRPLSNVYNINTFDDFFNKKQKYFDDLFGKHEKAMKQYIKLFDSSNWGLANPDKNQQIYKKYYLNDWKKYSYEIKFINWVVSWVFIIDDKKIKKSTINELDALWLGVADLNSDVVFSWRIEDINSLLKILN